MEGCRMNSKYDEAKKELRTNPKTWLITGVAGFIGSNLLEELLLLDQHVIGLDNFSTGHKRNLEEVEDIVGAETWKNFKFLEGDITNFETCKEVCSGVDYVLHQAALGSVPRSIDNPIRTNENNISGFLNMLVAAKEEKVKSFTYAASSSTYGDHKALPKIEDVIGNPLSPYAITKYVNELYADVFSKVYGFNATGLRYFNVFGKRQDPNGAYAAVIPKWTSAMINQEDVFINGDGETSRDFCFVENAVQANILSAVCDKYEKSEVFNVALGDRTTLNELFSFIRNELKNNSVDYDKEAIKRDFRPGDVRHSQADISKAKEFLGYSPNFRIADGIKKAMPWYKEFLS